MLQQCYLITSPKIFNLLPRNCNECYKCHKIIFAYFQCYTSFHSGVISVHRKMDGQRGYNYLYPLLMHGVAQWRSCTVLDLRSVGSNPCYPTFGCNPGKVVSTHVPLSPSSIVWYQTIGGNALRLGR